MSYTEARSHFEKGTFNTADKGVIEMLDGLKHLSHAIEAVSYTHLDVYKRQDGIQGTSIPR